MLVCYDGDTARVATSVLRARNIQASSIRGGMLGFEFGHLLVSADGLEQQQQLNMADIAAAAAGVGIFDTPVMDHQALAATV